MKKEALSYFDRPELILFAFILFFVTFIGITIWTFSKSRKNHFRQMSEMPLKEDPIKGDLS